MGDGAVSNEKGEKTLTDAEADQEEYLKCLDEEFKSRYTEADLDFKKVWESDVPTPPILLDFDKICDKNQDNYNRGRKHRRNHPYHRRDNNRPRFNQWE